MRLLGLHVPEEEEEQHAREFAPLALAIAKGGSASGQGAALANSTTFLSGSDNGGGHFLSRRDSPINSSSSSFSSSGDFSRYPTHLNKYNNNTSGGGGSLRSVTLYSKPPILRAHGLTLTSSSTAFSPTNRSAGAGSHANYPMRSSQYLTSPTLPPMPRGGASDSIPPFNSGTPHGGGYSPPAYPPPLPDTASGAAVLPPPFIPSTGGRLGHRMVFRSAIKAAAAAVIKSQPRNKGFYNPESS